MDQSPVGYYRDRGGIHLRHLHVQTYEFYKDQLGYGNCCDDRSGPKISRVGYNSRQYGFHHRYNRRNALRLIVIKIFVIYFQGN